MYKPSLGAMFEFGSNLVYLGPIFFFFQNLI
jgi:hypothetical protein